jgi:hypothetical protein
MIEWFDLQPAIQPISNPSTETPYPNHKCSNYTYRSHIVHEVHVMVPNKVREWVGEPDHVNIVVHDAVSELKNLQQVPWPP